MLGRTSPPRVAIDTAGGAGGGAGRFRSELEGYLARADRRDVQSLGAGESVRPAWLLKREILSRGCRRSVAANNVCYATAGDERWVLTRNANHFLTPNEWNSVKSLHPAGFERQVKIVRSMLRRADRIVAPTSEMADRVATIAPRLVDRIVVRFHPFTSPVTMREPERMIVCPIVDSPYKRLNVVMQDLAEAVAAFPEVTVVWTTPAGAAPAALRACSQLKMVGVLDRGALSELYQRASAIYYPTEIESFGYPLAEGRALGVPVIALDTSRTREVAAGALVPFKIGDTRSLKAAVSNALDADLAPEPGPFDPDAYFDWMFQ